jgi:regulator of protease activity HflC (stomatin/prohibitin superfamily)
MGNQKDVELPQYNQLVRAVDPELLLKNASGVLDVDLESARHAKKIVPGEVVSAFSDRMQAESELRAKFDLLNSQFDI